MRNTNKTTFFRQDPFYIPGYGGHLPQYRFTIGGTFAQLTQNLLLDPPWNEKKNVLSSTKPEELEANAFTKAQQILEKQPRLAQGKLIYGPHMVAGYAGHVPLEVTKYGHNFSTVSKLAVAEHEERQRNIRKYKTNLDLAVDVQDGKIHPDNMPQCVQVPPMTLRYGSPLERIQANHDPYKSSKPFLGSSSYDLPNNDPNKYIMSGYSGHVPLERTFCGHTHKVLTHQALTKFRNGRPFYKPIPPDEQIVTEFIADLLPEPDTTPELLACQEELQAFKGKDLVQFPIEMGLIPHYAGHLPGYVYLSGDTFGNATKELVKIGCPNPLVPRKQTAKLPERDHNLPPRLHFPYF